MFYRIDPEKDASFAVGATMETFLKIFSLDQHHAPTHWLDRELKCCGESTTHKASVQPLENGEIIRPLGAQLVFEFLVGKDTFFYQELYGSIGHCQCADREFLQCNGVFF